MRGGAADWVLSRPWAITEDALGVILAVAERRNESPEAVEAKTGRPLDNSRTVTVRDGVAIVPVIGPIARYADLFTEISGATSIDTLAKDFRTALDDRSVKAIVLNVDSPGGTVAGISEFANQVREARGTKPIVAYVGSQAASAGYWIASAADRVVADSTAILGSIGVVMGMPRKKASDPITILSSQSPRKRPDPETEAGRSQVQAMADDLADLFVEAVAANRDVPRESVLADFGQGDQFVASKAVSAGMADSVGSLEAVIACLARGEMPCPKYKPARKGKTTKEPAMSEPTEQPVAGDTVTLSASEVAELRRQAATGKDADARIKEAREQAQAEAAKRIESDAKSYASMLIDGKDAKAMPYQRDRIVSVLSRAMTDDRESPVAGSPTARQDDVKSLLGQLRPHGMTEEVASGGPQTRTLGEDPYSDNDPEAAELERIDASTRQFAKGLNGRK